MLLHIKDDLIRCTSLTSAMHLFYSHSSKDQLITPYWVNGVDIGAFELPEAQMRLGWEQENNPPFEVTFTLTAIGTYWEKDSDVSPISSDQDIQNSDYISYDINVSDKEEWNGFHFKWMLPGNSDEAPFGHAFYKLTNSENGDSIYIDMRDAITSYNPNIYIRYNNSPGILKYQYFKDDVWDNNINNGEIIRIWDINSGDFNTSDLNQYFQHALIPLENNNHPRIAWGPLEGASNYTIKRKYSDDPWNNNYDNVTDLEFTDEQLELVVGEDPEVVLAHYKVGATTQNTNEVSYYVHELKMDKKNHSNFLTYSYSLNQNFPNPFNPTTNISFTLESQQHVNLKIYDILGNEVCTLLNQQLKSGAYKIRFDASELASGIYFYSLVTEKFKAIKKMQIIK